jgi:hypothetical protein
MAVKKPATSLNEANGNSDSAKTDTNEHEPITPRKGDIGTRVGTTFNPVRVHSRVILC